jgi:hypothetical protein
MDEIRSRLLGALYPDSLEAVTAKHVLYGHVREAVDALPGRPVP